MATFKAQQHRLANEQSQRAWLVWHIEALRRMKRLPRLKTMLVKQQQRSRQTWQEQMAIMEQWAAAMSRVEARKAMR